MVLQVGARSVARLHRQYTRLASAIQQKTGFAIEWNQVEGAGDAEREAQALQEGVRAGELDLVAWDMRAMPEELVQGLVMASVPERGAPWEALFGGSLEHLAHGAIVGTASERHSSQLHKLRPDFVLHPLQCDAAERIEMQREGALDAVVVDLETLDAMEARGTVLALDEMVPAVGQGALALVCRVSDVRTLEALESVHHHDTALCIGVERAFLMDWRAESKGAVGCHAWREGHHLVAEGCVGTRQGVHRLKLRSDLLHGFALGRALARQLQSIG